MMYVLAIENTKSVYFMKTNNHNINFFIDSFNPKYVLNKYRLVIIIF